METTFSNTEERNFLTKVLDGLHNISVTQRRTILVLTDILIIQISMLFTLLLKYNLTFPQEIMSNYLMYALIVSGVMIFSFYINNLYYK